MTLGGYSTQISADVLSLMKSNVLATFVHLEVGVTASGIVRSTTLGLEVTSEMGGLIRSTSTALEVLCHIPRPTPYVPDRYPPWTIKPTWDGGITERLIWLTDVLTSETGVEQRRRLRNSPRREIDVNFIIWRAGRRLFDSLLMGVGAGGFHFPLWWEKRNLTQEAFEGDTTIYLNTSYGEFVPGCQIMILGSTPFIYELLHVNDLGNGTNLLNLQNTLAQTWPAGTSVYMTKIARITGTVAATRRGDDAWECPVTFQVMEPNDYPMLLDPVSDAYVDYPIPFRPADMEDDITFEYQRIYAELDNQMSVSVRRDLGDQGFVVQQLEVLLHGRQQHATFKSWLYFMCGKVQPQFVPTFFRDMNYLSYATTLATDDFIFIDRCGISEYMGNTTGGRKIVGLYFRDGTNILCTLELTRVIGDNVETMLFTAPIGKAFGPADLKRISFGNIMRQDSDQVEILHYADVQGASTCTTVFRTISDNLRVDDPYVLTYYTGSYVADANPPPIPITPPDPPVITTPDPGPIYPGDPGLSGGGEGDGSGDEGSAGAADAEAAGGSGAGDGAGDSGGGDAGGNGGGAGGGGTA